MKQFAARQARGQFRLLLETVRREPVRVTKGERPVSVMVSMQQHGRLQDAAGERIAGDRTCSGDRGSCERLDRFRARSAPWRREAIVSIGEQQS